MAANQPTYWAVVPAAGAGRRMGGDRPKQYLSLAGKTILEHSLGKLLDSPEISGAVVAISDDDGYWGGLDFQHQKPVMVAPGGNERSDSVLSALQVLSQTANENDWVLVHDAARPCVRREDISQLINTCKDHMVGGILAVPVKDTIKMANESAEIIQTVDRSALWHAQTPQMFQLGMLQDALSRALASGEQITDEASAMEWAGYKPLLVEGHSDNIKITRQEDIELASCFFDKITRSD